MRKGQSSATSKVSTETHFDSEIRTPKATFSEKSFPPLGTDCEVSLGARAVTRYRPEKHYMRGAGPKSKRRSQADRRSEAGHDVKSRASDGANAAPSQRPLAEHAARRRKRDGVETSPHVSDEIRQTTCYMCACRCGIDVHITRRRGPLHPGQPRSSGQPRRAVRQGQRRHHAALQPGAAAQAAAARRRARLGRIPRDRMGRGADDRDRSARPGSARPTRRSSPSSPGATSRSR